ncbi:RNA polymerase sigma-70 factor, ECF subfamily [Pedobacter sp. ok626]|uniref:RNA polymerase sigma-70 factor n=1 Tax=Pedobacter sp. ok626 TaxID=1761882 RepID=UPI000881360E|nr:RNA polymerase sigma-70 factor [Pedobacter sp. ok626]SDL03507.1 RNA polymerase sigma-70 factor, ECF subfamily [Pedobacter sp. ok626]
MIDYNRLTDQQLMTLLKESDSNAYAQLYDRYFQLLFVYAYKRLRDEAEAKDVIQDFFTVLWVKRDTLNFNSAISAYFFTAINNRIIDFFLHRKVADKYIGSISMPTEREEATTDHLVREKQLMAYIEMEIQALPSKMRKIFELSRKSNYTYKEIAGELSISEKTVHRQMSNALIRLRTKLGLFTFLIFLTKF